MLVCVVVLLMALSTDSCNTSCASPTLATAHRLPTNVELSVRVGALGSHCSAFIHWACVAGWWWLWMEKQNPIEMIHDV